MFLYSPRSHDHYRQGWLDSTPYLTWEDKTHSFKNLQKDGSQTNYLLISHTRNKCNNAFYSKWLYFQSMNNSLQICQVI